MGIFKTSVLFASVIFFLSCKNGVMLDYEEPYFNKQNGIEYCFVLQDSVTKISILTPKYLDTSLCWIHRTCGIPNQKNRIQSKKQPIFLENGFYWDDVYDKTEITFKQQYLGNYLTSMSQKQVKDRHKSDIEEYKNDPLSQNLIFDTILKVNAKYYSLLGYIHSGKKGKKHHFIRTYFNAGKTYVRGEFINTDTNISIKIFERDCIEMIKSLRINPAPSFF